jgi:hypothetical protein
MTTMTNNQMIEGRFLRWHRARVMVAAIVRNLTEGRTVVIATMTQATRFDHRHVAMFKAAKNGAFLQRGRKWVCIDYCAIRVFA